MSLAREQLWALRQNAQAANENLKYIQEGLLAIGLPPESEGLRVREYRIPGGRPTDRSGRNRVEIGFAVFYDDWARLQKSEAWEILDRFVKTLQTTGELLPLRVIETTEDLEGST